MRLSADYGSQRLPLIAMQGPVRGKRSRGRPQWRWINDVKTIFSIMGLPLAKASRLTQSREEWRNLIVWNGGVWLGCLWVPKHGHDIRSQ